MALIDMLGLVLASIREGNFIQMSLPGDIPRIIGKEECVE
jgi:hypothetical protein